MNMFRGIKIWQLYRAFILTSLLGNAEDLFSQSRSYLKMNDRIFSVELDVENGGILAAKDIKEYTFEDAYYNGINLRLGWQKKDSLSTYDKLYNNPTYGIGLYSSTFGKNDIGNPYAIYGFIRVPFHTDFSEKWKFDYRIGLGLSGNFKPYDEQENPLNLVIGSKNNVFIDFGIQTHYQLSEKIRLGMGLSFHHFSNGALQLPNKGINLIPLNVSATYSPSFPNYTPKDSLIDLPRKWLFHINYGAGFKQVDKNNDKLYFKSTLSLYGSKYVNPKWRMGLGVDLFYAESGNDELIAGDRKGKFSSMYSGGPAFYLVHVLNPRLLLNGNIGYYLHKSRFNGEIKKTFLRAGVRYYVYKNINTGVSIKAHLGKADYIEWVVGYTIGERLL